MFNEVGGSSLILKSEGNFRTSAVFVGPDNILYAKNGGSFVRLYQEGRTSRSKVFYEKLAGAKTTIGRLGELILC